MVSTLGKRLSTGWLKALHVVTSPEHVIQPSRKHYPSSQAFHIKKKKFLLKNTQNKQIKTQTNRKPPQPNMNTWRLNWVSGMIVCLETISLNKTAWQIESQAGLR